MKVIVQDSLRFLLRFDRGEEVIEGLKAFVSKEGIGAAHCTAIGAAGEVLLSYYDLENKKYEDHSITEDVEIVGVVGNIAWMDASPVIHAHGTFGRKDLSVIGGHIKRLVVSATCEVYITPLQGEVLRAYDDRTGLNLLA